MTVSSSPVGPPRQRLRGGRVFAGLAEMSPANFGMVMATGIVSLAAHLLHMPQISQVLFQLNVVLYVALWILTMLRLTWYPRRFFGDMVDHLRGRGFSLRWRPREF